jgi:hypothetical protein
MQGYKFNTEAEAIAARKQAADHYGIPVNPEDVTQYWVDYNVADLDDPKFWYIAYHESLDVVFGEPTEFEVTIPAAE